MAKRFEFHLQGMDVPEGLIDADRLVEIVKCLQEMATRIGRLETDSARRGRPSASLERVAGLRIGLDKGSTTIVAERDLAQVIPETDLADEEAVDLKFAELIEGIGSDQRPEWVTDSLAMTADYLVVALQKTAPKVELKVDGVSSKTFETHALHRETWTTSAPALAETPVDFTGRLVAVNLNSHHFQVQDDVGHKVGLPKVRNDVEVGKLVGDYVTATGAADVDDQGRITALRDAQIVPLDLSAILAPIPAGVPLEEILASAPGPDPGGGLDLTDEEFASFLEAVRG